MEIENGVVKKHYGNEKTVVIPEGVEQIGQFAFAECRQLEEVVIPESVTEIGPYAFEKCTRLRRVTLPPALTVIACGLFVDCIALEEMAVPENVTEIDDFAFSGCVSLGSVRLPEGLERIGSYAFHRCKALSGVSFPDALCSIGHSAFQCCESLRELEIPAYVAFIQDETFSRCSGLKQVRFRSPRGIHSVIGIGKFAFDECTALETVEAPRSLQQIQFRAFGRCNSLKTIVYDGTRYDAHTQYAPKPVLEIIQSIGRPSGKPVRTYTPPRPFPAGYPYKDEFEYLNDGED